jgi:hypothetical protein
MKSINIIFTESKDKNSILEFVEVEDEKGQGIKIGKWSKEVDTLDKKLNYSILTITAEEILKKESP